MDGRWDQRVTVCRCASLGSRENNGLIILLINSTVISNREIDTQINKNIAIEESRTFMGTLGTLW